MATYQIYKLQFTSPLHISNLHEDESVSQTTIMSDTLYAALTSCIAKTGKPIPDNGDLGFTVSSLFPYYQKEENSKPVFFLPLPLHFRQVQLSDVTKAKSVKKVKWVDVSLYGDVLSGDRFFDRVDSLSDIKESYLTRETLAEDADGSKEFVRSEVSQRVMLESRTGEEDAKPYYVDKIVFKGCSGLYFIVEGDTELLDSALQLLSLEGIGTDRNVGFGLFRYSKDHIEINLPQKADHQIALSLLIPESEEQLKQLMDSDQLAYDFTRRGGWITTYPYNTLRKNAIYGFLPGSVFKALSNDECPPVGKIVCLSPDAGDMTLEHPIWRCGRSVMLPIKL